MPPVSTQSSLSGLFHIFSGIESSRIQQKDRESEVISAAPLHTFTKKNVTFQWTPEYEESFYKRSVDHHLCVSISTFRSRLLLSLFWRQIPALLDLEQVQLDGDVHPIACASRAVDKHEKNYIISELETLHEIGVGCMIFSSLSARPSMWVMLRVSWRVGHSPSRRWIS